MYIVFVILCVRLGENGLKSESVNGNQHIIVFNASAPRRRRSWEYYRLISAASFRCNDKQAAYFHAIASPGFI